MKYRFGFVSLKNAFFVALLVVVAGTVLSVGFLLYIIKTLPSVEQIKTRQVDQSTKIYDRTGNVLLYEISAGQKRTVVALENIPRDLKNATIAVEDERFYTEPGFDWKAIIRAFITNVINRRVVQGGSTITQQLAKKAFLSDEQTILRKIKELVLAIELNRHLTKDQILSLYLNEIPYGPTAYGIEAASELYFGKTAKDLTLPESAILAAIPRAPSYYSPWGAHTKELIAREQSILQKMYKLGEISEQELSSALAHKFSFVPQGVGIKAPHFVMAVQDYLVKKYGDELVRTGGFRVVTTLDWDLQQAAEKAVADGAKRNEQLYSGKNSALVAEDPKTGQILGMVGSRDYFDVKNEGNFNVATQGLRQPGSALKPFVYMTAFKKGYVPETVIFDVPTEFAANNPKCPPIPDFNASSTGDANDCFHPQNFDDKFRGPVPLRRALAQSINVPAVKVLYLSGLDDTLKTLKDFGITTLDDPSRYGLSLVLGGGEVRLVDLIEAYSTLSQEGLRHDQTMILGVKDKNGATLESYTDNSQDVIDPQYPRMVNDILSDSEARSGLFSGSLPLTVFPDHDAALKTGTSNDYRDAWALGYTPSLVAGVWAGNNDNTPMQRHGSSILAAVPIWHDFMVEALKKYPPETFVRPEKVAPTKPIIAGSYLSGGNVHSILYYVNRKDPTGPEPSDPSSDPQFTNWETGVSDWAKNNIPNFTNQTSTTQGASSTNSFGFSAQLPQVTITNPRTGSFVKGQIDLRARIVSSAPIFRIRIYWNNEIVREFAQEFPNTYELSFVFTPHNPSVQNKLEVQVIASDNLESRAAIILYE